MRFLKSLFQRSLVGLDIGVSGIKAVELDGAKTPRLIAYNRVPLPWNAISPDGEVRDRDAVIDALKRLFSSTKFSTRRVAVGASGNSVMTKKITVPKMKADELEHQLFFEAEQYLPFPLDEVNLDFAILGPNMNASTGNAMMDVLLVAAKKEYVEQMVALLEAADLTCEVVDNQAFALGNAFEFNYGYLDGKAGHDPTSMIIDVGAGSTKVTLVEGDKIVFARELRKCGLTCTQMLSERLGLGFEQAERLKILDSGNQASVPVIQEFVSLVAEEILQTVDFCMSQSADKSIQGFYLCGGASRTLGLIDELEARLPAPVQALNPVQNVSGSGKKMNAQAIRELSYLGAVAIGLSLRHAGDAA